MTQPSQRQPFGIRGPVSRRAVPAGLILLLLSACEQERRLTHERPLPRPSAPTSIRTSDLAAGDVRPRPRLRNPYEGNPHALQEGRQFYAWMNCHGCHGMQGGGGIGPPFADSDWIYGSSAANIYQSIVQGRPNGMPSYDLLSDDVVWKIVSYVRTLDPELARQPLAAEGTGEPEMEPESTSDESE